MSPASSRWYRLALLLLLLADVAKHALTFATGPTVLGYDALEYWKQGAHVLEGDWFQLHDSVDYRTPLYPLFLAALRGLFADDALLAVVVVQHGLQIVTDLLTAHICWQISGRRSVALAGYGLSVLCLTGPWFANVVLTESLFTLFMTATVGAIVAYHLRPSASRSAAVAAFLALTILMRPVPQLLGIPLLGVLFWRRTSGVEWRQLRQHALVAIGTHLAVLAPWCVRNWIAFDRPFVARLPAVNKWQVCFQDGSAAHLPLPNNASGRRMHHLLPETASGDARHRHCGTVVTALKNKGLSDRQIDDLITNVCLGAIREHPRTFLWATFKRSVNFWRCTVKNYPFYSRYSQRSGHFLGQRTWRLEPGATWYEQVLNRTPAQSLRWNELVLLATTAGTVLLIVRRQTRLIGLSLTVVFLYFGLVTAAVEVENYRYRMVLEPCMIIAVACGLIGGRAATAFPAADRKDVLPAAPAGQSSSIGGRLEAAADMSPAADPTTAG